MSQKAEIKKIVLELGDQEIELSLEQANKLHSLLEELFGKKTEYVITSPIIIDHQRPYWDYHQPVWTSQSPAATPYDITYSADNLAISMSL
jgi:hypothetical protein